MSVWQSVESHKANALGPIKVYRPKAAAAAPPGKKHCTYSPSSLGYGALPHDNPALDFRRIAEQKRICPLQTPSAACRNARCESKNRAQRGQRWRSINEAHRPKAATAAPLGKRHCAYPPSSSGYGALPHGSPALDLRRIAEQKRIRQPSAACRRNALRIEKASAERLAL